jgi:hypothetical protein
VVVVDMEIAVGLYGDVHARMPRQEIQHMIEESDAGRDIGYAGTVQIATRHA